MSVVLVCTSSEKTVPSAWSHMDIILDSQAHNMIFSRQLSPTFPDVQKLWAAGSLLKIGMQTALHEVYMFLNKCVVLYLLPTWPPLVRLSMICCMLLH